DRHKSSEYHGRPHHRSGPASRAGGHRTVTSVAPHGASGKETEMASCLWHIIRLAHRRCARPPASPCGRFPRHPIGPTARSRTVAVSTASVAVLSALATGAAPAAAGVRAGAPAPSAFQAAIRQIVKDGVPGAIGLARHGSQVTVATIGLADVATQTPMTPG